LGFGKSWFLTLELVNTNCFPCSLMLLYVVAVSTTQRDSLAPRMSCDCERKGSVFVMFVT